MPLSSRLHYYRRIFGAYVVPGQSQLTFWHETPAENGNARADELGEYYMTFFEKADYPGHYDSGGIPMLNYHGRIGLQYNPIAIAQWGLGNYNLYLQTGEPERQEKFLQAAHWLVSQLEQNKFGVSVWHHHFDWEYKTRLRAPWYSALAQGQGISLLVRAHRETGDPKFLDAARRAFVAFTLPVENGGVVRTDGRGETWFEEYMVAPPTHILNGFIWAAWGVHDYSLATGESSASALFRAAVKTLINNLDRYDCGFWSLYEQSGTRVQMLASPFYHRLHIVQLRVMHRLTGDEEFAQTANRWEHYARSRGKRTRALCYKAAFKLCYY